MMNYVSQLKEKDTSAVPNCLCGDQGRNRNEGECNRRKSCEGCGFDRKEYMRRINLIHDSGLTAIGEHRKEHLLKEFKTDVARPLYGLYLGKRLPVYEAEE